MQKEDEVVTRTINVIAGMFMGGNTIKSTQKKHCYEVLSLLSEKMKKTHKPSPTPEIVFSSFELERIIPRHNNPMIISTKIVNAEVKRVVVD